MLSPCEVYNVIYNTRGENMILRITIIGLLAGVIGTGLGGIISALFKRNVDRYLDFFMGLSGGIMLAVVVFDLMKESMNEIGVLPTVIFTFVGVLLTMFLKTKLDMSKEMKAGYLIFTRRVGYRLIFYVY